MPHNKTMHSTRIASIDALRGFVMVIMIFVNDLGLVGSTVPDWMVHFNDRATGKGMTFVDLVLPAFLFIVGMSIPFSIGTSQRYGKPLIQIILHILIRTLSLLFLGIIEVNDWLASKIGWHPALRETLIGLCAMLTFCQIVPPNLSENEQNRWRLITEIVRIIGFVGLLFFASLHLNTDGEPIISISPFHINISWWGILGIIGWAYFIASNAYLVFNNQRTALLGCMVILMCIFPAAKIGIFKDIGLAAYINIGATLGVQPAIAVAGMLLSTILLTSDTQTRSIRIRFTVLFMIATIITAILINGLYGISKNAGTPTWALWACAITAGYWLIFYMMGEIKLCQPIVKLFNIAGFNVLLAYLLSCTFYPMINLLGLREWYDFIGHIDLIHAILRAFSLSIFIISVTAVLNYIGFRLKL